ncbi:ABC transporter permease [Kribbia dieselivorans]|uniref:ABC transporter permease n=1 Tax=Kribbia dieselivorans TaxID=331526 RepID=UPI0008396E9B|nr:ABC transporter permease [Kribbia dieselivorans]
MSTVRVHTNTDAPPRSEDPPPGGRVGAQQRAPFIRQVITLTRRNLTHIKRQPEMLSDVTIQPVMFVLLFAYVFGGSIQTNGSGYREWIMAQTMAFSAFVVAFGLSNDLTKGVIDRFRSLPINRGSVLVARSTSSLIHSSLGVIVMSLTGLIVGWRVRGSFLEALAGYALLMLFGFAMIWLGILVGSVMRSVEGVNGVIFTTIFPLTFLANTFAPSENMPHWLRVIAEWNPISSLVQAMRDLWGNGAPPPVDAQWPLHHPIIATIAWAIIFTAILAPLAMRAYVNRTRD